MSLLLLRLSRSTDWIEFTNSLLHWFLYLREYQLIIWIIQQFTGSNLCCCLGIYPVWLYYWVLDNCQCLLYVSYIMRILLFIVHVIYGISMFVWLYGYRCHLLAPVASLAQCIWWLVMIRAVVTVTIIHHFFLPSYLIVSYLIVYWYKWTNRWVNNKNYGYILC